MKMTINTYLANSKAQSTQNRRQFFGRSEAGMFFSLAGRHDEYKSRGLKIEKFGTPWPGGRALSCRCLRKSKNCVWLRGDWQLVTLPRLFVLFKNKKNKKLLHSLTRAVPYDSKLVTTALSRLCYEQHLKK